MADEPGTNFDCGCRLGTKDGVFAFIPCSETCDTYAYAIEAARKSGKPIATLDFRGSGQMEGPGYRCPHCEARNDGFTGSDRRDVPAPGNLSVCAYCRQIGIFTEDGIRKPSPLESVEINADPNVQAMRKSAEVVWGDDRP